MAELISLVVDRKSIEKLDYSIIQDYMDKCSESKNTLTNSHSRLDFSVFGYDDDDRQLCEIIEVINWVNKSIYDGMPWFYFLSKSPNSQGLKILALCYIAIPQQGIDGCWHFKLELNKINECIGLNFTNMNNFIDDNIGDESLKSEISQQILTYYQNWLDSYKRK
jgi:hypothetical protein